MANEFKHLSVGGEMTQAEYEAVGGHVLDSQARGDIIYASSTTQLSRLGVGGAGAVLTSDGTDPVWDTTWSPTGHLIPASDDSYDLGSAAAAWQDLFLEGDITLTDAGTLATSAGALTVTSAAAATWSTSAGALTLNGTGGVNLQEGGSTIIGISDSRALSTTNTASVDLDASGAIQINSSGGALSVGNDNVDQNVNIATAGTRTLNIGINDGTDLTTITSKGNITNTGTFTVGANDQGYDVIFYGDTASANMTWDTSADDLILNGAARIVIPDGQLVLGSTAVAATAAELNILDGVTATASELNVLNGVTAGTAAASKAVVLDGSKNIATIGTIGSGAITSTGTSSFGAASFSGLITANGGITFAAGDDITFTGGTGTNDIVLGNGLADALSITDGSADIIAISTAGGTNTVAITGDLTVSGSLTADTATVASTVTITDNESTNEDNAIIFTSGGDLDGGNIGLESDGDLHYNPSTGTLTATTFAGNLTGNVTGNVRGTAATVTGATQSAITAVGTLDAVDIDGGAIDGVTLGTNSAVTQAVIDNININGTTIGHTSDTDLLTLTSANLAVAGDIEVSGSHSLEVATIDYTDGDLAMTIADGGGVTFAQAVTADAGVAIDNITIDGTEIDLSSGDLTLDVAGDIILDAAGANVLPGGDNNTDLGATATRWQNVYAQKYHMDASIDGIANENYSGMSATIRVGDGASVGAFDLVCISDVDNEVQMARANAIATAKVIGINPLNVTISDNAEGVILVHGFVRNDAWDWTAGQTLYLSGGTAGDITATAPSTEDHCVVPIGVALEPDMIYFNPTQTIIEHTG